MIYKLYVNTIKTQQPFDYVIKYFKSQVISWLAYITTFVKLVKP